MVGIWWLSNFSVFLQHISTAENLRGFGIVILWTQLTMINDGILWVTNWGRTSSGVSGRGLSWQWLTMVAHCGLGMAGNGFMFNHQKVLKMKPTRKCNFCGKAFVARSGMPRYCCEECQTRAKESRKKRQRDFMNAVEPVIGLQCQEYLTFSKAAVLMGCSRQYV